MLLEKDPLKRLGCLEDGISGLKGHTFFDGIDWKLLEQKLIQPHIVPDLEKQNYCPRDNDFLVTL
jgi:hypothetical protein